DGDVDANARSLIAGIGQGGQALGGGPVERGQGVGAGGGDVVHRAWLNVGGPQRKAVRGEHRLDVAAVAVGLAGVPQVDDRALDAAGRFLAPVAGDDRAVQDLVGKAVLPRSFQRLAQAGGLPGEHVDDLVSAAAGGGPGDPV